MKAYRDTYTHRAIMALRAAREWYGMKHREDLAKWLANRVEKQYLKKQEAGES